MLTTPEKMRGFSFGTSSIRKVQKDRNGFKVW